jgi:hypothetical protein
MTKLDFRISLNIETPGKLANKTLVCINFNFYS